MDTTDPDRASQAVVDETHVARWDHDVDVVVVGSGCGGSVAAVKASQEGATVIVLEKAAQIGGTTAKGDGGFWVANNRFMREAGKSDPRDESLRFMARSSEPDLYSPTAPFLGLPERQYEMLAAIYDHGAEAVEDLEQTGAIDCLHVPDMPNYYAQLDEDVVKTGQLLIPRQSDGVPGVGADLIAGFHAVLRRNGVPVLTGHRVTSVVRDASGAVIGVLADGPDGSVAVCARKAVIFATGGFSHNPSLCRAFLPGPIVGSCSSPTNEGDFIAIAQAAGASLANMSNAWHGPMVLELAVKQPPDLRCAFELGGDSVLMVNRYGHRACNEKATYNEKPHSMYVWDPTRLEYPNLLMFAIWDQRAMDLFGGAASLDGGTMPGPGADASHVLREETIAELADALRDRVESLAAHTHGIRLDAGFAEETAKTIEQFNGYARSGRDPDFRRGDTPIEVFFHRQMALAALGTASATELIGLEDTGTLPHLDPSIPNPTMYPLSDEGPYYATILGPATLDTKGGAVTNRDGQVLDQSGEGISGLYAIGNCAAAPSGRAYWAGGATLGPIITFAWLAATHAVGKAATRRDLSVHG